MNAPTEDLLRESLFDDAGTAWADDDTWDRIATDSQRRTHSRRNRYMGGATMLATAAAAIAAFTFIGARGSESPTVTPLTQPPVTAPLSPTCSAAGFNPTHDSLPLVPGAAEVVAAAQACDEAALKALMDPADFAYESRTARFNGADDAMHQVLADEADGQPILRDVVNTILIGERQCASTTACNYVLENGDLRTSVNIADGVWYTIERGPATPITESPNTAPVPAVVQDKANAIQAVADVGDLNAVKAEAGHGIVVGSGNGPIDDLTVDDLEPIANALRGTKVAVASDESYWAWCWSGPSLEHCVTIDADGTWTRYQAGD